MFTDPTYRSELIASGALWDGGGVYSGANVYATYELEASAWEAYEGRTTPQTYAHSELLVTADASYYTTNYPSFGGLLSMIKNGQTGAYALSAAYTNRNLVFEQRISATEARLRAQYSALDTTMSKMNALSTSVTQQMTALANFYNSNNK